MISLNFYHPQRSHGKKGKVFTHVCQSFCSRGEGVFQHALGRHPSWANTSCEQTPPRQTPPHGQTPPRQNPLCIPVCIGADSPPMYPSMYWGRHPRMYPSMYWGRHPSLCIRACVGADSPPNGHCSGRCASYWNAFLFG